MSKEKDSAFEDFMKEAFGSEVESESQLRPGAPIFANREVPEDILQTAQQAMQEQTGKIPRPSAEETLQPTLNHHALADDRISLEPAAEQNIENSDSNSLKISRVRFIDNLPKKKIPVKSEQPIGYDHTLVNSLNMIPNGGEPLVPEPLQPPTPVSKVEPIVSARQVNRPVTNVSFASSNQQPKNLSATEEGSHSFREEILARLQAEAESYSRVTDSETNPIPPITLNEQNIPIAPGISIPQPEMKVETVTPTASSKKAPSKDDYLTAVGARPKKSSKAAITPQEEVYISRKSKLATSEGYSRRNQDLTKEERKVQKKKRNQKSSIHIGRSIMIILVLVILALGGFGYFYVQGSLKAVDSQDKTALVVNIPESTSSQGVAQILKKNNLIKNTMVFTIYTKFKGLSNFKSGYYSLNKAMDTTEIATALEKGGSATSPAEGKITIPEGYTINQIETAITINADSKTSAKTPYTQQEFLNVVKDPTFIADMVKKYPNLFANLPAANSGVKYQLEGYLFPATYSYSTKTTMKDIVEQMIAAMDKTMQPYYAQLSGLNLNVNDLLSLAALVEREANTQDDRKNVADVFLKRLNENMTLGSNVALLYAEGKLGSNVSAADDANVDTSMDSPFNLYKNQGVGPGPVDSPSAMSIDAVINHTKNSYYYFIADKNGALHFATTQAEQDTNVAQYLPSSTTSSS